MRCRRRGRRATKILGTSAIGDGQEVVLKRRVPHVSTLLASGSLASTPSPLSSIPLFLIRKNAGAALLQYNQSVARDALSNCVSSMSSYLMEIENPACGYAGRRWGCLECHYGVLGSYFLFRLSGAPRTSEAKRLPNRDIEMAALLVS
jgi:hypothetical protein